MSDDVAGAVVRPTRGENESERSPEGWPMLTGTLDDFDLRHVLRFLASAQKTGRLTVVGSVASGKVFFRAGHVYHAESDVRREGFGRKLVNAGKLSEARLLQTLEACALTGRGLGESLVAAGHITRDDLEAALRDEVEDVVHDLLRNRRGRFTFETGVQVDADTITHVRVDSLIREEDGAVRARVPVLNPDYVRASIASDSFEISVSAEEWTVIALIDGRRTFGDIAAAQGRDVHDVVRVLRRLLTVGLVTLSAGAEAPAPPPARRRPPPPPPPPPPSVIDLRTEEPARARPRP